MESYETKSKTARTYRRRQSIYLYPQIMITNKEKVIYLQSKWYFVWSYWWDVDYITSKHWLVWIDEIDCDVRLFDKIEQLYVLESNLCQNL